MLPCPLRIRTHASQASPARCLLLSLCIILSLPLTCWRTTASAELRTVTAEGEYRMGDRDTKEDAVRLATERAKRNALEQVAVYLESVTVVNEFQLMSDEVRAYTAGLVLVLDQRVATRLEGETVVIHVDLTAQVDSEEITQAIAAMRQNEDARRELTALRTEVDELHQRLDQATQALAVATTPDQVRAASELRHQLLNQVQSNGLVSQAWTDWVIMGAATYPTAVVPRAQLDALVAQARALTPTSPRVYVVQQVMAVPSPPPPAARPVAPAPLQVPRAPEFHPLVSPPSNPTIFPHAGMNRSVNSAPPPVPTAPGAATQTPLPRVKPVEVPGGYLPPTLHQTQPPHLSQQMPHVPRAPFHMQGRGGGARGSGGGGGRRR